MKVNLNNNISQSKLNFKANFSSNNKTQVTLEKMLEKIRGLLNNKTR